MSYVLHVLEIVGQAALLIAIIVIGYHVVLALIVGLLMFLTRRS